MSGTDALIIPVECQKTKKEACYMRKKDENEPSWLSFSVIVNLMRPETRSHQKCECEHFTDMRSRRDSMLIYSS